MFERSHLGTTVPLLFLEMSNCFRVGGTKDNAICWKENWARVCPSNKCATDFSNNTGKYLIICLHLFVDRLQIWMHGTDVMETLTFLPWAGIITLVTHSESCSRLFSCISYPEGCFFFLNKNRGTKKAVLAHVSILNVLNFWMLNAVGILSFYTCTC